MRHTVLLALSAACAALACAHAKPQPVSDAEPVRVPAAAAAPAAPTTPALVHADAAKACSRDDDCDASSLCLNSACVKATAELPECSDVRVHFDFDSSLLRPDDASLLQGRARCFLNNAGLRVTITGHADERGTEDYNVALGSRRADAVAKYLEALGVSKSQVKTVSYGFEKPVCHDHSEGCWAQNRRGDAQPK